MNKALGKYLEGAIGLVGAIFAFVGPAVPLPPGVEMWTRVVALFSVLGMTAWSLLRPWRRRLPVTLCVLSGVAILTGILLLSLSGRWMIPVEGKILLRGELKEGAATEITEQGITEEIYLSGSSYDPALVYTEASLRGSKFMLLLFSTIFIFPCVAAITGWLQFGVWVKAVDSGRVEDRVRT